jgi:hypothetical protein
MRLETKHSFLFSQHVLVTERVVFSFSVPVPSDIMNLTESTLIAMYITCLFGEGMFVVGDEMIVTRDAPSTSCEVRKRTTNNNVTFVP